MDDTSFGRWLQESRRSLKELYKPIGQFRREEITFHNLGEFNYKESLQRYLEKKGMPDAQEKLWLAVTGMCRVYLDATAYQRAAVRNMFDSEDPLIGLFSSYPYYAAEFIRSPGDVEWLRLGLAGALINDARTDYRDIYVALGELYLVAEKNGIDPVPHFETVGTPKEKGSPPSTGLYKLIGGNYSQSLLTEFLESDFLKSTIEKGKSEWYPSE